MKAPNNENEPETPKYKCQKVARLTTNGYLNYLREYKKRCCGMSPKDTVRYGAREWNKLSAPEKVYYKNLLKRKAVKPNKCQNSTENKSQPNPDKVMNKMTTTEKMCPPRNTNACFKTKNKAAQKGRSKRASRLKDKIECYKYKNSPAKPRAKAGCSKNPNGKTNKALNKAAPKPTSGVCPPKTQDDDSCENMKKSPEPDIPCVMLPTKSHCKSYKAKQRQKNPVARLRKTLKSRTKHDCYKYKSKPRPKVCRPGIDDGSSKKMNMAAPGLSKACPPKKVTECPTNKKAPEPSNACPPKNFTDCSKDMHKKAVEACQPANNYRNAKDKLHTAPAAKAKRHGKVCQKKNTFPNSWKINNAFPLGSANAYINFLREYRRLHCDLKPLELLKTAAHKWICLRTSERCKYDRPVCNFIKIERSC